jgi:hypothetical protein
VGGVGVHSLRIAEVGCRAALLPSRQMPRKALQLPYAREEANQVGKNLFRKQILPREAKIEHANGTLEVTPDYLADLAENFNQGAFDQVPFLLANEANQHHMDPEKFRGELKGVEVGADGLYGLIELTDDGARVVAENPKLGVSARLIEAAKDGKDAIQHVLGTLDPRAKGLKPWEAVNLSDDDTEVTDLTEAEVVEPETPVASTPVTKTAEKTDLSAEEAKRIFREMLSEETDTEPQKVELSEEQRKAIELAEQTARSAADDARKAREELADERYDRKRNELAEAGVPPALIELAEPILRGGSGAIELSNGTKVDAHNVVEKLLDEFKGMVDLSTIGVGASDSDDRDPAVKRWVKGEKEEAD